MTAQKIRRRLFADPVKGAEIGELVRDAQQSLDGLGASIDALSVIGDYAESMGVLSVLASNTYSVCANAGLALGAGTYDLQAVGRFKPSELANVYFWQISVSTTKADDAIGVDLGRNTSSGMPNENALALGNELDFEWIAPTPLYRVSIIRTVRFFPKVRCYFGAGSCDAIANIFSRRVR